MSKRKVDDPYFQAAVWADSCEPKYGLTHVIGACVLLAVADGITPDRMTVEYRRSKAFQRFARVFKPQNSRLAAFWLECKTEEESKQARVIALLLASAMHNTGDL